MKWRPAFVTSLETRIDAASALHPNPGRRTFQRLTRAEYARSIHDLLYRPQLLPEEPVLEALLANLAAGMREMKELLRSMPEILEQSAILGASLAAISRLASEICGECVPRNYAPALKQWMDRIQGLARAVSASRDHT